MGGCVQYYVDSSGFPGIDSPSDDSRAANRWGNLLPTGHVEQEEATK